MPHLSDEIHPRALTLNMSVESQNLSMYFYYIAFAGFRGILLVIVAHFTDSSLHIRALPIGEFHTIATP